MMTLDVTLMARKLSPECFTLGVKNSLLYFIFLYLFAVSIFQPFFFMTDRGTSFIRPMGLLPTSDHTHYAVVKSHSQDTSRMESLGFRH